MSGSALVSAGYHSGNHACLMYAIARSVSQPANNTKQLIAFLKRASAIQIQNFIDDIDDNLPPITKWAPVIESNQKFYFSNENIQTIP